MHDPTGIKKRLVRRLEAIFVKVPVISPMIPSDTIYAYKDPCNFRHKTWHNPWNPDQKRTESLYDLFDLAAPVLQTAYMLTLVLSVSAPMSPWKIFTTPEIPSWKNTAIYLIIRDFHYQYVKISLR